MLVLTWTITGLVSVMVPMLGCKNHTVLRLYLCCCLLLERHKIFRNISEILPLMNDMFCCCSCLFVRLFYVETVSDMGKLK